MLVVTRDCTICAKTVQWPLKSFSGFLATFEFSWFHISAEGTTLLHLWNCIWIWHSTPLINHLLIILSYKPKGIADRFVFCNCAHCLLYVLLFQQKQGSLPVKITDWQFCLVLSSQVLAENKISGNPIPEAMTHFGKTLFMLLELTRFTLIINTTTE